VDGTGTVSQLREELDTFLEVKGPAPRLPRGGRKRRAPIQESGKSF